MRSGAVSRATESSGTCLQTDMTNKTKGQTQDGNSQEWAQNRSDLCAKANDCSLCSLEPWKLHPRSTESCWGSSRQASPEEQNATLLLGTQPPDQAGHGGVPARASGAPPAPGPQNPTSPQLPLSPNSQMRTTCNAARGKTLLGCIVIWVNHRELRKARPIFHIQFQNLTSFTLRRDQPWLRRCLTHLPTLPEAPGSRSK
jgi:hypothetical protein